MKILVTGTAGFIGYHLVKRLVSRGDEVVGIDSINSYYDINLKYGRLSDTGISDKKIEYGKPVVGLKGYRFVKLDICDAEGLDRLFESENFGAVCHLAAQAGVRYSITSPSAYIQSNIIGFFNMLECCRKHGTGHLVYASSSSVYGLNEKTPFSVSDNVDHPISLYAASKKSNELMAHTYSHLYGIPSTGLRFFTVYGPWGRPDMAYFKFTESILNGRPIDVYNNGEMMRDFTYISDIIEGVTRVIDRVPSPDPGWSGRNPDPGTSRAPYRIYNIGNSSPVGLLEFIGGIESVLGIKAEKKMLPIQPGDVPVTFADVRDLADDIGYSPSTKFEDGIRKFIEWYLDYHGINNK
ncbi:MAG: NAD-dependent epimerase [Spirochaetes bacterium]|jgi:UDP-glucuronate 4-epimerase|nr:NAD-dependent epimerase [Spirochaetota bacterium]